MARAAEELLRRTIRGILRESDGGDKSDRPLGKVLELVQINTALKRLSLDAGLDTRVQVGLMRSSEGDGIKIQFALRTVNKDRKSDPTSIAVGDKSKTVLDALVPSGGSGLMDRFSRILRSRSTEKSARAVIDRIPYGSISIGPRRKGDGECKNAFSVRLTTFTKNGWGPLLYDLAIESASDEAGGLMSDRGVVSGHARSVWSAYDTSRPDVEKVQLDVLPDLVKKDPGYWGKQITPDKPEDDCNLIIITRDENPKEGESWQESPLSRVYRKPGREVTGALEKLDLLW